MINHNCCLSNYILKSVFISIMSRILNVEVVNDNKSEIAEVQEVIIENYQAVQADTFKSLGTVAQDWTPTPLKAIIQGFPVFDKPAGYTEVHPITQNSANNGFCELCGHDIVYAWWIQCDSKKLLMMVGSTCVNTFMGADYTTRTVKIFKENELRQAFKTWLKSALAEIETHRDPNYSRHIEYSYYKFRQTLLKTPPEELSSTKIKNLFKKARSLGLAVPLSEDNKSVKEIEKPVYIKKAFDSSEDMTNYRDNHKEIVMFVDFMTNTLTLINEELDQ